MWPWVKLRSSRHVIHDTKPYIQWVMQYDALLCLLASISTQIFTYIDVNSHFRLQSDMTNSQNKFPAFSFLSRLNRYSFFWMCLWFSRSSAHYILPLTVSLFLSPPIQPLTLLLHPPRLSIDILPAENLEHYRPWSNPWVSLSVRNLTGRQNEMNPEKKKKNYSRFQCEVKRG